MNSGNIGLSAPLVSPFLSGVIKANNISIDSTGKISWPIGLGIINHIVGPSDQPLAITSMAPILTTIGVAGNALTISASSATAGSLIVGAVTGGSLTISSGNAARLTSGNANGGALNINAGSGIGTGIYGLLTFQANGGNVLFGNTTSASSTTPLFVSFGGTFGSNTPGSAGNLKWALYDDGSGAGNRYGIGMSSALMELRAGAGAAIALYADNGTECVRCAISGRVGIGVAGPSAILHLKAGAAGANFAPLKFTSGTLLTAPETGALEFLTDNYYGTTTTNTIRRMLIAANTGRFIAQSAAIASVATYTLGASDASFEVSGNVLVTVSTLYNFTMACDYTDEGNTTRTITFSFSTLAGTFINAITNAQGAVPFEGVPLHIRCKANTSVNIYTTGSFTTVTYNAEGVIKQIA